MKKSDLQTGHIIETRSGETGLIAKNNVYGEDAVIFNKGNWTSLDGFTEDLYWYGVHYINMKIERTSFCETVDIMKVYEPILPTEFLSRDRKKLKLIWERDENKYIKIDGKKYDKNMVMERIKELKPIKE